MVVDPVTGSFWAANEVGDPGSAERGPPTGARGSPSSRSRRAPGNGQHDGLFRHRLVQPRRANDKAILDAFAARLIADPTLIVTIEGYTDTTGRRRRSAGNQKLANDRAMAVFNYLTNTHGIAANRLTQVGFGELQLLVPDRRTAWSSRPIAPRS